MNVIQWCWLCDRGKLDNALACVVCLNNELGNLATMDILRRALLAKGEISEPIGFKKRVR